jgi:hypothetical protein
MVSIIGTTATGFLQNDACWRTLERLPAGELRSPYYLHLEVDEHWQDLVMAPVPGAPGTHAVGVPLAETPGKAIRYYVSTMSDGGERFRVYAAR